MKVVYMRGSTNLSAAERQSFAGCQLENALVFKALAVGITSAVLAGDFPVIEKALKDAEIPFTAVELEADAARVAAAEKAAQAAQERADALAEAGEVDAEEFAELKAKLATETARADEAANSLEAARAGDSAEALEAMTAERDSALSELDAANAVIAQQKRELAEAYGEGPDDIVDVYKVTDGEQNKQASWHNVTRAEALEHVARHPDNQYNIVLDSDS